MSGSGATQTLVTNLDWLWWSAAGVMALVGLILWLWAMFWDRSRGRRRCPRCWYDLEGTEGLRDGGTEGKKEGKAQRHRGTKAQRGESWRCPECGKLIVRERRMFRTRRRWRWAAVAIVIGVGGGIGIPWWRAIERGGFWATAPTWVLIRIVDAQGWPEPETTIFGPVFSVLRNEPAYELSGRTLSDSQQRFVWENAIEEIIRSRTRWPRDIPFVIRIEALSTWVVPQLDNARLTICSATDPRQFHSREYEWMSHGSGAFPFVPWSDDTVSIGVLPEKIRSLQLEVVLDAEQVLRSNEWSELWKGDLRRRVTLVDSIQNAMRSTNDSIMTQDLEQLFDATLLYSDDCGWRLRIRTDGPPSTNRIRRLSRRGHDAVPFGFLAAEMCARYPKTAFGLRLEVLLDGSPVGTARCWLDPMPDRRNERPGERLDQLAITGEIDSIPFEEVIKRGWSIRVSSDPEMALRDFGKPQYWNGEFEMRVPIARGDWYMNCFDGEND